MVAAFDPKAFLQRTLISSQANVSGQARSVPSLVFLLDVSQNPGMIFA